MFFDMNISNTKSKNLVLASPLKQNLQNQKLVRGARTDYGAPNQRWSRGHKARDQGDEKIRGQGDEKIQGQGQKQPFQGQTLSRPRTGMLEDLQTLRPMTSNCVLEDSSSAPNLCRP